MNENETVTKTLLNIPKLSFVMLFSGFLYIIITIIQFGVQFYDKSQLISNIAIGCSFFVLAYIHWYFRINDGRFDDIKKDFQSLDNRLNTIELKVIKLNQK